MTPTFIIGPEEKKHRAGRRWLPRDMRHPRIGRVQCSTLCAGVRPDLDQLPDKYQPINAGQKQ
jgi:hypothetical protein